MMDLKNLIPQKTSRGDPIFLELNANSATVYYKRRRGRPGHLKIRRRINKNLFLVGVTIWACEGTRTRPYELEVTNSSETIAKVFVQLLRQLGITRYVTLRVHAPADGYEKYRRHWEKTLGINRFEKPITTKSRGREIKSGIIHIRIYGAVIRELFYHWASILPHLLQTSREETFSYKTLGMKSRTGLPGVDRVQISPGPPQSGLSSPRRA